jgi:hypothetical protein
MLLKLPQISVDSAGDRSITLRACLRRVVFVRIKLLEFWQLISSVFDGVNGQETET